MPAILYLNLYCYFPKKYILEIVLADFCIDCAANVYIDGEKAVLWNYTVSDKQHLHI